MLSEPPQVPLPDPARNPSWFGEFWLRYPRSETLYPIHFGYLFNTMSDMRILINDLATTFFDIRRSTPAPQIAVLQQHCQSLEGWYRDIPEVLNVANIKFPWELKLQ